jgi:hypothetical protein
MHINMAEGDLVGTSHMHTVWAYGTDRIIKHATSSGFLSMRMLASNVI